MEKLKQEWTLSLTIFSPPALFFFFLFSVFNVEISSRGPIPLFKLRTSPQWLSELRRPWTSVPKRTECELFSLMGSRTILGQHSQPTPTLLGTWVCAYLAATCHLHFLQNYQGLLRATAVIRRWNGWRNNKSEQKVNPGEENFPVTPAGDRISDLPIKIPVLYRRARSRR